MREELQKVWVFKSIKAGGRPIVEISFRLFIKFQETKSYFSK
jgi:hypothetical protein